MESDRSSVIKNLSTRGRKITCTVSAVCDSNTLFSLLEISLVNNNMLIPQIVHVCRVNFPLPIAHPQFRSFRVLLVQL